MLRATTEHGVTYHTAATLTGPITTGHVIEPLFAHPLDLAASGYVEQQFFASGTATAFTPRPTQAVVTGRSHRPRSAPYETRILAPAGGSRPVQRNRRRRVDERDCRRVRRRLAVPQSSLGRNGYAWVGVSAQRVGVDGGRALVGVPSGAGPGGGGLVVAAPARTARSTIPATSTRSTSSPRSATRSEPQTKPALGGLRPRHVVAAGESQSAAYLTTFADAVQPRTHTFDGVFIHSRFGSGASLDGNFSGRSVCRTISGSAPICRSLPSCSRPRPTLISSAMQRRDSSIHPGSGPGRWRARHTPTPISWGGPATFSAAPPPPTTALSTKSAQAAFAAFTRWVVDGFGLTAQSHPHSVCLSAHPRPWLSTATAT